ncbi:MAG: type II secretion system inner membrane protein GspF [Betaproteobacteria bacterium]|nr:type II secretion system inner membrane protein GspF [Betaproteobacteria bacterium]
MTAFRYKALDASGKATSGMLESDSAKQVRVRLREQNLVPVAVEPVNRPADHDAAGGVLPRLRGGIGATALALLTRQFATLLGAGMTIEQALNALIEQGETAREKAVLAGVRSEVMAGHSLASAMRRFPRVFPDIYATLVMAGEQSGQISQVMLKLADYMEARHALRQKVITAMIYPAIVTVVAFAVIAALLTYVVPQVVSVFTQTRQALPLLTRGLIVVSDFLRATWWMWLAGGVGAGLMLRRALRQEAFRMRWQGLLLRLPVAGGLMRAIATARFSSAMSILAGSGVPMLRSLETGAGLTGNLPMQRAVEAATQQVREGASLAAALKRAGGFPPMLVHLIASGEATGRLDHTLSTAARQQESEVAARLSVLTALVEPALILIMGGVVMVIVLAVLMPIIEMNQLVR